MQPAGLADEHQIAAWCGGQSGLEAKDGGRRPTRLGSRIKQVGTRGGKSGGNCEREQPKGSESLSIPIVSSNSTSRGSSTVMYYWALEGRRARIGLLAHIFGLIGLFGY
jgi:hypothetical protein